MSVFPILRSLLILGKGTIRGLSRAGAGNDPIRLFGEWFDEAQRSGVFLPEAIAVATSTRQGSVSVRMMLLKSFDESGFVFYTNYESRKGVELEANPSAAFVLYWNVLQRQIRVEGTVERLAPEESLAYFRTRERGSRLGAWASRQSSALEGRHELECQFEECEKRFEGKDIPLPPFWGGFRLRPEHIEFWQGRANRLHDRISFVREGDDWTVVRLSP
jgi:pyridoxamine 5'-phosphate oxidase